MINLKKVFLCTLIFFNTAPYLEAMKEGRNSCRLKLSESQILPIQAECYYAEQEDIPQILELMDLIAADEEDSKNLVIFPETMREEKVTSDVENKRMFVTKIGDRIIAFLKLYLISDNNELTNILTNELRCCNFNGENLNSLKSVKTYYHDVRPSAPKFTPCFIEFCPCKNINYIPNSQQTYLYYGGAFTHRLHRGSGYGSFLLHNAFTYIQDEIISDVQQHHSSEIILSYGQAEANKDHTLMIRQFAQVIPVILG